MAATTTGRMNFIGTSQILMVWMTNSSRSCYNRCRGTRTRMTTAMSLVKVTSLARTRTKTIMTMATATSSNSTVKRRMRQE